MACAPGLRKSVYNDEANSSLKRPDGNGARPKEKTACASGPRKSVYNGEANSSLKCPDGNSVRPKKKWPAHPDQEKVSTMMKRIHL